MPDRPIESQGVSAPLANPTPGDGHANVHLIAAAPELLDALRMVRLNLLNAGYEATCAMLEGIDAAIRKAEGRS